MDPINVTEIVAIVMGMLVVLIPVAGITLRFAIKPITESIARMREGGMDREKMELMERRMSLLEQEVHGLEGIRQDLARALEAADFQRQLNAPKPTAQEIGR
jgi:hypothetical protein